jgi:hypothetical protein
LQCAFASSKPLPPDPGRLAKVLQLEPRLSGAAHSRLPALPTIVGLYLRLDRA